MKQRKATVLSHTGARLLDVAEIFAGVGGITRGNGDPSGRKAAGHRRARPSRWRCCSTRSTGHGRLFLAFQSHDLCGSGWRRTSLPGAGHYLSSGSWAMRQQEPLPVQTSLSCDPPLMRRAALCLRSYRAMCSAQRSRFCAGSDDTAFPVAEGPRQSRNQSAVAERTGAHCRPR